ncbi:MAG: hypothetical protein AAF270_13165 [Pseudomonadota bacterium]
MMSTASLLKTAMMTVCAALAVGCAGPMQTTMADGTIAYRIDCGGTARGLNYCLEKAGKSCGAEGYTIVAEDGRRLSSSEAATADQQSLFQDFASDRNRIFFTCGT